jgi:isopenicillin-N epimerase
MEQEPCRFLDRELEAGLDAARQTLANFVGADSADLAFVPNATTGVNAVLHSLVLGPGDEVLVTDHAYAACRNALEFEAARSGARVVVARIPFPLASEDEVVEPIVAAAGPRTRIALIDHVTSPTALILPVGRIVSELARIGVPVLVDGAHAPGMVPLNLRSLGAGWYTGNCHKWLCGPKGSAFLWCRPDRQRDTRPVVISHGASSRRTDRSRFLLEFDWIGTVDPTPWLCIPACIEFVGGLFPGGWTGLAEANRALALAARDRLVEALGVPAPCPDRMLGFMASVPLPTRPPGPGRIDPLQSWLFDRHGIEVPVMAWPTPPHRLLRVSAQAYNGIAQYERLARVLKDPGGITGD